MNKRFFVFLVSFLFVAFGSNAHTDTILSRYKQYLLDAVKPDEDIEYLLRSLNPGGQWPDINYADTEKANWKNLIHLKRVRNLALAYEKQGSPQFHSPQIWKAIQAGLNHWLHKRYKNSNWWHNQIGVPQYMRDIIILSRNQLTTEQLKAALEVMAQHHVYEDWVGANLTWSADLGFHYGALTNNLKLMRFCRDLIIKEIKVSTGEGVQPDFSFHQHGPRLQMYQYGRAFLAENIRLAWELRGTSMAFPKEKINILVNFALQGWQWMARGIHTAPGTMDRSASRVDALKSADLTAMVPYFIALSPENKKAFLQLKKIQEGKGALDGYRYYPYSDFTTYHQKHFSFFLKTISSRTLATESINSENLKGKLLHSGDTYFIRDGREYFNLMPVWNWAYLPGVTAFNGADQIARSGFTGSVSNAKAGLSVMDFHLESKDKHKKLHAKKVWAVAGRQMLCLIAGARGSGITEAYTTIDQCRWRGNEASADSWVYHSGLAYISLSSEKIDLQLHEAQGSWATINAAESSAPVSEMVFMPVLRHQNLDNGTSAYVVAACKNAKQAAKLAASPSWSVLQNDQKLQAVLFKDGTLMAAFHSPGVLKSSRYPQFSVDQPCLILMEKGKIWLSNPDRKPLRVKITLNNRPDTIDLPADGTSVAIHL